MTNLSDKNCRANQNTHLCSIIYLIFRKPCRLWDNVIKVF